MRARPNESPNATATPTRYAELARVLIRDIVDGRHVPGSLLPTEHELAGRHGVSRHTVRAALKVLEDHGYISRKKSVGTIVESANPGASYTQHLATVDDLVHVAATEVRAIESVCEVSFDRAQARRLDAPVGSRWLLFAGTRIDVRKGDTPVAWADIYIDPAFAHIADRVQRMPEVLVSALIERECGETIAEVHQVVTATLIDARLAKALRVDVGSAALRLVRQYRGSAGRILEISDTTYPADRVSVSFRMKRAKAG